MKLLFDQNISYKIIKNIKDIFPGSNHVYLLGYSNYDDLSIWNFAKKKNYIIVTQDNDFHELSILLGSPPKIIWIRTGNISSYNISSLIIKNFKNILEFNNDNSLSCLELY